MRFSVIGICLSLAVLAVSFWHRNEIPAGLDFVPQIAAEPEQRKTRRQAFDVSYNAIDYEVRPEYEYELHGLVVSYRHHDGKSRMHRRAGDHLNMLDVCVIWGDNVNNRRLDKIDFWNGIFTCNVKTRDALAWQAFDMTQLSNNHLISDRDDIREAVSGIRVGDQIRVRGLLARYESPGGERGTSVTRTDTGDGACETIYVEEFAVVKESPGHWRKAMLGAGSTLFLSLFVYLRSPYRPFANR